MTEQPTAADHSGERGVMLVAHRAANLDGEDGALAPPVEDWHLLGADAVEADVHLFRGRLEVRHSKALWPTKRLFEGRELLPRSASRPTLSHVLESLPAKPDLWIDLKGPDPRLPRKVDEVASDRRPLWVSARCWWQLATFRDRDDVRTLMSVGSLWQRPIARGFLARGWSDGIVMHERLATGSFLSAIGGAAPVVVWAVRSLDRAAVLIEEGVAGLIIDDPDLMRALIRHIAARPQ